MEVLNGGAKKAGMVLKGLLISYVVTTAALLILAFVVLQFLQDADKAEVGILLTYVFSCFVGGWYCGRKMEKRKFLWGILLGSAYFLILLAISGMGDRAIQSELGQSLLAFLLCTGGGMLGGMIAS